MQFSVYGAVMDALMYLKKRIVLLLHSAKSIERGVRLSGISWNWENLNFERDTQVHDKVFALDRCQIHKDYSEPYNTPCALAVDLGIICFCQGG